MKYKVCILDDGCRLTSYPCDLVIDSGVDAPFLEYKGLKHTKFLLGSSFFPLREEIRLQKRTYITEEKVKNILVTMGGSDPENLSNKLVKNLLKIKDDFRILVILGPYYKGNIHPSIKSSARVKLINSPDNIASCFASADLAISTAGNTASELAFLGIPSVLLSVSPDQVSVANGFDKKGVGKHFPCILNSLGVGCFDELNSIIQNLIEDIKLRKRMKKAGMELFDGLGAKRIASAIYHMHF